MAEQDCKWGGIAARFGHWHTIYMRMNRWAKSGVLDRVFEQLQLEPIVRIQIEAISLDSTLGEGSSGWNTKIHMGCRGWSNGYNFYALSRQ